MSSEAARFWGQVQKTGECWLWTGAGDRYGVFRRGSRTDGTYRTASAHRVSWELAHGVIPKGSFVCHHCDTSKCVRPDHLYLGTPQSNMDDKVRRGRLVASPGERNGQAKLTNVQVEEIRRRYAAGGITQQVLADEYSISNQHVCKLVKGQRRAG